MKKQIPLGEVQEGVDLSKCRGLRHLNDARALIKNGKLEGAAILATFGLEELGRIIILKCRYKKAKKMGKRFIEINDRRQRGKKDAFYDHTNKQKKALNALTHDPCRIQKGDYKLRDFKWKDYLIDIWLDQGLREIVTYIDYEDGWIIPPPIDIEKLKNCINEIEKALHAR